MNDKARSNEELDSQGKIKTHTNMCSIQAHFPGEDPPLWKREEREDGRTLNEDEYTASTPVAGVLMSHRHDETQTEQVTLHKELPCQGRTTLGC